MPNTEILAPVGGMESLIAAVRAGADAVYMGAQDFNARRNAQNFNNDELKSAVEYCRLNGVKCYLALNTLIKDAEMQAALDLVNRVWQYGIDAIIVQDLGLAAQIHKNFPHLALHASTQLSVHSPSALNTLKQLGFKRVVVAREMSKPELEQFCKKAKELGVEVEVFVHGALCMCISGQCYFSAYLGGRSANRGLCAGTCRLPFMANGGTGYDLSLKDLSLIPHLETLKKMGVASFKIEGRMKRPEYVATAVTAAKQMVDKNVVDEDITQLLEKVFSRGGFTDGYYNMSLGRNMFGVRTEQDKELSKQNISKTHELYRRERQRLRLDINFTLKSGMPSQITAKCNGITVTINGQEPEVAVNRPITASDISAALSKLGGTCYYLGETNFNIDDNITLPISAINNLRKQAVESLNQKRLEISRPEVCDLNISITPANNKPAGCFVRFANLNQCFAVQNLLDNLSGYSLPLNVVTAALKNNNLTNDQTTVIKNAAVEIPRSTFNEADVKKLLDLARKHGVKVAVCSNLAAVNMAVQYGFEVMGGFGLNLFNSSALFKANKMGVTSSVLSSELSTFEIKALCPPSGFKTFLFSYGRSPLMLTRNCPVKNGKGCKNKDQGCYLTDRKSTTFPVICGNECSEILNSKITALSPSLDFKNGCGSYLYFTLENPSDVKDVILSYLNSNEISGADYTRGLSKTGVM